MIPFSSWVIIPLPIGHDFGHQFELLLFSF